MAYLTAERLLALAEEQRDGNTEDIELLGGTVKVRGMTAAEDAKVTAVVMLQKQSRRGEGTTTYRLDERQRLIVKFGLVEPKLNENELSRFITTVGAIECSKIVRKVVELSGGDEDDDESADEKATATFPEPREPGPVD